MRGLFDVVRSDYAYLTPSLSYSPQSVDLQLVRLPNVAFADQAQTPNLRAVADSLENLPRDSWLYEYVLNLPAGTPAEVFNSLSGEVHASMHSVLPGLSAARVPSISLGQLRNNLGAGWRPGAPIAQAAGELPASAWPSSKALPVWAELVGYWQRFAGDASTNDIRQQTSGLFLGAGRDTAQGWRVGGTLGYTDARARMENVASTSTVRSYSAALYGGKSIVKGVGYLNLLGGVAYTWHDIATERRVSSLGQTLPANYGASTVQLFAEAGCAWGQFEK